MLCAASNAALQRALSAVDSGPEYTNTCSVVANAVSMPVEGRKASTPQLDLGAPEGSESVWEWATCPGHWSAGIQLPEWAE